MNLLSLTPAFFKILVPCHSSLVHFFLRYRLLSPGLHLLKKFAAGGSYRGAENISDPADSALGTVDGVLLPAGDLLLGDGH